MTDFKFQTRIIYSITFLYKRRIEILQNLGVYIIGKSRAGTLTDIFNPEKLTFKTRICAKMTNS